MSNELANIFQNAGGLMELGLDEDTLAVAGNATKGNKRISIEGRVFRKIVGGKEQSVNTDNSMNVIIVKMAHDASRTFYNSTYKKGVKLAPACWSNDSKTPDPEVKSPCAPTCAECPNSVKGSGQGDSRACRYSQRLAVVLANDVGGEILQLTLPASSIFGAGEPGKWPLQTYAKMIGSKGVPITAVVTEMRFDTDSATPKLAFKPVRVLDAEEHAVAIQQGQSASAKSAITMTVAEVDNAKPPAKLEAKAEAKVESVTVEVEAVEEPTKRTAKKEEAPAPKKDISKLLTEWDDA
jgi:hypothetical protein